MDPKRNCSERMRPILQAMERSIDSARRSRVGFAPPPPSTPASSPASSPPVATAAAAPPRPSFAIAPMSSIPHDPLAKTSADSAPRLKARPKRLDAPLGTPFQNVPYRSQTG